MRRLGIGLGLATVAVVGGCGESTSESRGSDITLTASIQGFAWSGDQGDMPPSAFLDGTSRQFSIDGTAGLPPTQKVMGFNLLNVTGPGVYQLQDPATSSHGHYVVVKGYYPDFLWTWFWTSSTVTGTAVVTEFDPARQHIKGTFSFDAVADDGSIVQIREGIFKAHYAVH